MIVAAIAAFLFLALAPRVASAACNLEAARQLEAHATLSPYLGPGEGGGYGVTEGTATPMSWQQRAVMENKAAAAYLACVSSDRNVEALQLAYGALAGTSTYAKNAGLDPLSRHANNQAVGILVRIYKDPYASLDQRSGAGQQLCGEYHCTPKQIAKNLR